MLRGNGNVKCFNPKISGRVSRKMNSQGPLAFVQVDNRAMHPNEAPLGRDRAPLCLSSSPAFVPLGSDVFLCVTWLLDTFWEKVNVYSRPPKIHLNIT